MYKELIERAIALSELESLVKQVEELKATQAPTGYALVPDNIITGACYDLMGYLTTRDNRLCLSTNDESSAAVVALTEWLVLRGLNEADARVADWQEYLYRASPIAEKPQLTDGELLPCPFCGGEAAIRIGEHIFYDAKVTCQECGAEGTLADSECQTKEQNISEASKAWNTRAILAAQPSTGWISVEDELPPSCESVIVCNNHEECSFSAWYDLDRQVWLTEADLGEDEEINGVTHWMMFPVPPTGELTIEPTPPEGEI